MGIHPPYFKIVVAFLIVSAIFIGLYFNNFVAHISQKEINKSIEHKNKQEVKKASIVSYEENKSLDAKYKSVTLQIEEFIRKQKAKDLNKTIAIIEELNLSKIEHQSKITPTKKIEINELKKRLPKLAIIMDDIGYLEQIESIKKIPFPITPSIFPPNGHYPDTKEIAKNFKYYMVHLPMEAYDYLNVREKAIKVIDTKEIIEQKIKLVKQDFPNVIAINNHTGSKFTCDLDAMNRFFIVLNRYNIAFIDSRTDAKSKCLEAAKMNNREVMQRDIFLDNIPDEEYIKEQLKKAVRIAKRDGQAIAICHPKELTFQVLMNAKNILNEVELVFINELM